MDHDITLKLRLVWLPQGRPRPNLAFEVVCLQAPYSPDTCPPMEVWQRHVQEPMLPPGAVFVVTNLDEPSPLPADAEFVLLLSFTGGGAREGAEQFYDWRALSQAQAHAACADGWGADLLERAGAARELVQLPAPAFFALKARTKRNSQLGDPGWL